MSKLRPSLISSESASRPRWPVYERRRVRTDAAGDAMEMALNWSVARGELEAIVVVDEKGMLVCQSRSDVDLAPVAAVLPIVSRGQVRARITRSGLPCEMSVERFQLGGEEMYLGVLGGSSEARTREARQSLEAAQRILG